MLASQICLPERCSGCAACANVCPHQAIRMVADADGFRHPRVAPSLCVDCGLCQKRCPQNAPVSEFRFPHAVAFAEPEAGLFRNAASGGAFGVVGRHVIAQGGVVFGCRMYDNRDYAAVRFCRAASPEELKHLQGSKYVQAEVDTVYQSVRESLREGRLVLFGGCPCQVAALKSYLGCGGGCDSPREYANLITADLVCHGVPSQSYFHAYRRDVMQQSGASIYRFRLKPSVAEGKPSVYAANLRADYYYKFFQWGVGLRGSCYTCRFAGGAREGDITIGDYSARNFTPVNPPLSFPTTEGASVVLFNTPRGRELEQLFTSAATCQEVTLSEAYIHGTGGQLFAPTPHDWRTPLFFFMLRHFGIKGVKNMFFFERLKIKWVEWKKKLKGIWH